MPNYKSYQRRTEWFLFFYFLKLPDTDKLSNPNIWLINSKFHTYIINFKLQNEYQSKSEATVKFNYTSSMEESPLFNKGQTKIMVDYRSKI